jgi:hypothetical protein
MSNAPIRNDFIVDLRGWAILSAHHHAANTKPSAMIGWGARQNSSPIKPQRTQRGVAASKRSADSLVRGFLANRLRLADKAVRAPGESSQDAMKLGDSSAENTKRISGNNLNSSVKLFLQPESPLLLHKKDARHAPSTFKC